MRLPDDLILKEAVLKDQYFDLQGLSEYSSIGVTTLRDYIRVDGLPCFRVKGKILVRKSEFDKWMENFRMNGNMSIEKIADEVIGSLSRRSEGIKH